MAISNLTPVEEWPTRKLPQDRFDAAVKTAMDQMSVMIGELNSAFIPQTNEVIDTINGITPDLPTIIDAPNQAAAAAASAKAAASSKTAATQSASEAAASKNAAESSASSASASKTAAAQSATEAAASKTDAAQSATEAASSKTAAATSAQQAKSSATTATSEANRAKEEADRAASVVAVDIATPEKAGIVKPDGTITTTDSDGTLKVSTFTGAKNGLVPASGAAAGKVLQGDGTWEYTEDATASMTISADLHLTADSPRALVLTATTSGLSVYLPDHSTLLRGTVFHIFVRSPEDIQLRDFSGQAVKAYPVLSASTATRVQLIDASTGLWALSSYSQWITSNAPGPRGLSIGDQFIFYSSVYASLSMDVLSEQKAIVCYGTSRELYAVVLSVSDTDIVVGDAVKVSSSYSSTYDFVALSADKGIVCYANNNTMYAAVLSISGMTVTVGNSTQVSSTMRALTALSADKVLYGYVSSSSVYLDLLSISGNTVTTVKKLSIGNGQKAAVTATSETTALVCLEGENSQVIKVSVSGNSITKESSANLLSTAYTPSLTAISEEKALVAYQNANSLGCVKVVTLSGSNVYVGPELVCSTRRLNMPSVAALSEKSAVVCFLDNDGHKYGLVYGLGINQDTVRVTEEKIFNFNPTKQVAARRLSPSRVLAAFLSSTEAIGVAETITLL